MKLLLILLLVLQDLLSHIFYMLILKLLGDWCSPLIVKDFTEEIDNLIDLRLFGLIVAIQEFTRSTIDRVRATNVEEDKILFGE